MKPYVYNIISKTPEDRRQTLMAVNRGRRFGSFRNVLRAFCEAFIDPERSKALENLLGLTDRLTED